MAVLYESGTPAWDIGQILTRHAHALWEDKGPICARVKKLRANVGAQPHARLRQALETSCDCGAGDSVAERTSLRDTTPESEGHINGRSTGASADDANTSQASAP